MPSALHGISLLFVGASSSGFDVWFSASGLYTYVFFSSFPPNRTLSTILNTGRSILEEVINGSFLLRVLASRGVGAGLDEGRCSRVFKLGPRVQGSLGQAGFRPTQVSMFLDLTSVGTPGHRRDRGCASRVADSVVLQA